MAIRKDIDDMLNNLKSGKPLESPKNPEPKPIPKLSDSKMSVDDLLSSIAADKNGKKSARETSANESKPKKKIVISHELPDYETIRAEEQQKEKKAAEDAEKARIAAEKRAAEKAEKERIAAEKRAAEKAEKERIAAEKRAAEKAEKERIAAEKRAAEKAEKERIAAEKRAAEKAEKERIAAEKKAAEIAEKERIAAEKKAAEIAEKERIAAEKKAAEDAEKARIETEKKAEEENLSDAFSEDAVAAYSAADIEDADEFEESSEEVPKKKKRGFFKKKNAEPLEVSEDFDEEPDSDDEKKSNRFTSALKNILDEDPEEIINQRKEQNAPDDKPQKGRVKKGFYAVFGVIFALLACVGLVTVITRGIAMFGSYTSGESRKEGFEDVLYPAVIMDIESFNSPAELPSEQIITAAIWSMILTDGVTEQYELTFDVVIIPAADVESYAVKLFGDELPKLEHTTVGPAESRFYYNEETKSYNVPVAPVTYTYAPEIREASKSGNEYTVIVDYIDELPSWLPKTSSKSVQYVLTEVNGAYQLKSMKILNTSTNAV